jgi:TonB family protein
MPWPSFSESLAYHILAMAAVLAWLHWTPRHITQVDPWKDTRITYPLSAQKADLPKLDTGSPAQHHAQQGDPLLNRQRILSVPREPDNRAQTIVTPPDIVLRNEVHMPNIVAWTNLPLAPPLSSAGLVSQRTVKALDVSVVAPPPQVEMQRRNRMEMLQTAVVAPPAELQDTRPLKNASALTSAAVAPAPVDNSLTTNKLGALNIGRAEAVAPAPQLAVGEQRAADNGTAHGRSGTAQAFAAAAVPPPPTLSGSTVPGAGRMVALSLHPDAPSGAVVPPPGNRRGEFEVKPTGSATGSGKPTIPETGKQADRAGTGGTNQRADLPTGLQVGDPKEGGSNTGDPASVPTTTASISIDRYPLASAAPPRVSPNRKPAVVVDHPPTDAEKKVFGGRRFYSMTLNMPNLNSAGGSWIVRFAELSEGPNQGVPSKEGPSKGELFSPLMTRKSDPAYPLELQRANVQGTVALYAIIHSDGSVRDIRVLDSVDDQLDRFASEALSRCKFEPAVKNGEPVALEAVILVPFRARRGF